VIQIRVILKTFSAILSLFYIMMAIPLTLGFIEGELAIDASFNVLSTTVIVFLLSTITFLLCRQPDKKDLNLKSGFLLMFILWTVLPIFGATPFIFNGMGVFNALFEATSGLTTTGATIIPDLSIIPDYILLWRSLLEWIGGLGIIVLAVVIVPILGVGGASIFKAETPGPNSEKLSEKVTTSSKILLGTYVLLTVLCGVLYYILGMPLFEAVNHSLTTISIGGFSTTDSSFIEYSDQIKIVAILFMFIAGTNFYLHFHLLSRGDFKYFKDLEFMFYAKWALIVVILVIFFNYLNNSVPVIDSIFNSVSILTTTGFTSSNYEGWGDFIVGIFLISMFIGACAGSTGGGMKIIRLLIVMKQGGVEIKKMLHPNGIIKIKMNGKILDSRTVEASWGYLGLFLITMLISSLILMFGGIDFLTAISASVACISNTGPAMGMAGPVETYGVFNDFQKTILLSIMVVGRLEVFAFLILLSKEFWRD